MMNIHAFKLLFGNIHLDTRDIKEPASSDTSLNGTNNLFILAHLSTLSLWLSTSLFRKTLWVGGCLQKLSAVPGPGFSPKLGRVLSRKARPELRLGLEWHFVLNTT